MKTTSATCRAALVLAGILFLSLFGANAQKTVVSGQVLDSLTRQGEPSAVLQFFKASDMGKPIAFTTTDGEGNFSQVLTGTGEYSMLFSNMGRRTKSVSFTLSGQENLSLGEFLVSDDVQTLNAGQVQAQRNLVKMDVDKMTYDVQNDVDSKTLTVLDMLRKVPMVSVDGQDNITVNGSSSFQVTVDGRPNVMLTQNASMAFKSMPASAIKDIQVITNPGVRYDAEGVGGVLNITMAKTADGASPAASMDGYNATVGLNASTQGFGGRVYASLQKGRFSASANLNLMTNDIKGSSNISDNYQLDPTTGNVLSHINTTSTSSIKAPMRMASIDLGYEIDSLRLISASFGYMNLDSRNFSDNLTTMLMGGNTLSYGSYTESTWGMGGINAGLDYQRVSAVDRQRALTLSYRFSYSPSETDSRSIFDKNSAGFLDLTDRYTDGGTGSLENTFQVDYTSPLGSGWTISTGAKYINRVNSSVQDSFIGDSKTDTWSPAPNSIDYRHANNIVAGYAEASLTAGKWGAKAGARYEHTFVDVNYRKGSGNDFSTNYGNLVPSASLQYNLGMMSNIGLSYNMRISRPGITYLNPYVDTSSPTARTYGNSSLGAETAHTFNLVYNFFSPKVMVNATLRETYSPKGIASYSFYDGEGLLNTTYGNIVRRSVTGLNTFVSLTPTAKTRIMLNAGVDYNSLSSEVLGLSNGGFSANIFGGLQQTIFWDMRLSANVMWSSRMYTLEGYSDGMAIAMGGLTKTFLSDRLSIGINGAVPLKKDFVMSMYSYSEGKDYRMESTNTIPLAQLRLSVSYSFGNTRAATGAKKSRRSITNDDVMDRDNGASGLDAMGTTSSAAGAGAAMGGGAM